MILLEKQVELLEVNGTVGIYLDEGINHLCQFVLVFESLLRVDFDDIFILFLPDQAVEVIEVLLVEKVLFLLRDEVKNELRLFLLLPVQKKVQIAHEVSKTQRADLL